MATFVSVRLIAILSLALVLVGVAVATGIAFTPALCTVAAFLSAVIIVVVEAVRKLFIKPSNTGRKP
ncbi:MAG: hypothetical protein WB609_01475 [Candidatus Cybelea sp.]